LSNRWQMPRSAANAPAVTRTSALRGSGGRGISAAG
jgi:hypothetical protein